MSKLRGKAQITGLSGGALSISSIAGYISPNMQSLKVKHSGDVKKTKSQSGEVTGLFATGDFLECSFDFIPEGSSGSNTTTSAKISATLPTLLAGVGISGLPIVAMGPFVDALNTNGSSSQPWFYEGEGEVTGPSDDKWTLTLTLRRYPYITSGADIT